MMSVLTSVFGAGLAVGLVAGIAWPIGHLPVFAWVFAALLAAYWPALVWGNRVAGGTVYATLYWLLVGAETLGLAIAYLIMIGSR